MNTFLKNILSSAIGVVLAACMFIGSVLILIIVSGLINKVFDKSQKIEPNSIVKIKFDQPISDKPNTDPFANFNPLSGDLHPNNSKHLYKILSSIELAANNKNIDGIILDLNGFQSPGQASIKEIRNALKKFKEKNKFIYSYSNYYGKTAYYLASVSDSVFMYPTGRMELSGLSSTIPFFTETMKEIGVKPEIIRHGKFKAAVEPFLLTEMSSENREQTEMLLNDLWKDMLEDISETRNLTIDRLNQIADDIILSMLPNKPLETGLIDGLIYPDQFNNLLVKKLNKEKLKDINFISLSKLNPKKNRSKNKIAIIYAEGNIDGDIKNIHSGYTKTIRKVLEDENVDALILRVNSPGGSALISDEILSQMKSLKNKKPIVVSMGNYAASGGYYISCAADKILASPNTITGSIGVFGLFFTAEELLTKKMKLHFDNVKTNKFSNMGEVIRSLSDNEKELIQVSIKDTYNNFINHVSEGRKMTTKEVDKIGQGRVWTGIQAKKLGLVDELGGLMDAIKVASELAQVKEFKIIEFPKMKNSLEAFFNDIEEVKSIANKNINTIYLEEIKSELLKMQGIQALLPIQYKLD